jgi:hypothetical protein
MKTTAAAIRAAWLRWNLAHVEASIKHTKANLQLAEHEAERLRVELAMLGGLRAGHHSARR